MIMPAVSDEQHDDDAEDRELIGKKLKALMEAYVVAIPTKPRQPSKRRIATARTLASITKANVEVTPSVPTSVGLITAAAAQPTMVEDFVATKAQHIDVSGSAPHPPPPNSPHPQHQTSLPLNLPLPQDQASPVHISPTHYNHQTRISELDFWFNQEDDGIIPDAPFPLLPKPKCLYTDANTIYENKAKN